MKTKLLLLLLAVFTMSANAQTFDWEGGTTMNAGGTFVRQTVAGVRAECTNSSNNIQHTAGGGFAGSTGFVVSCGPNTTSLTVTFNAAINIQSIYALDGNASPDDDWTFAPTGGINSNVIQSIGGSTGVNVNVNWTNVTAFTITSANGIDRFTLDDIVFTPCVVNIPGANFKNYLVGNTNINTNGDTEIQCSEASAFTGQINCPSLFISDMTGIEAFTALTELRCQSNNILSLDVSNNTALTLLWVQSNSLTSLDVSNNTLLENLSYGDNSISFVNTSTNTVLKELYAYSNPLTNLDISNNTALELLWCNSTQRSSLDISNHSSLTRLLCHDNSLTSLNVANGVNSSFVTFEATGNPNLTCITVDDVAYSDTNWSSLIDPQTSFSTNCNTSLGIEDNTLLENFKLYPNPVRNILNIQLEDTLENVEVFSIQGQKVLESTNSSINVSSLPSGMYLVKVLTQNGKVGVKRFIKE